MATPGNRVPHSPWDNDVDVKVRDIVKQLEDDGWSVVRQRGSHRQSSTRRNLASSPWRASQATMWRRER